MTKGERLVRVDFNVSGSSEVDQIKTEAARLIDRIEALPSRDGDTARHKALAITAIEEGSMWGVKAATASQEG